METVCMKCQNLFSGKNKKNISICYLLKILPRVLSIKLIYDTTEWKQATYKGKSQDLGN